MDSININVEDSKKFIKFYYKDKSINKIIIMLMVIMFFIPAYTISSWYLCLYVIVYFYYAYSIRKSLNNIKYLDFLTKNNITNLYNKDIIYQVLKHRDQNSLHNKLLKIYISYIDQKNILEIVEDKIVFNNFIKSIDYINIDLGLLVNKIETDYNKDNEKQNFIIYINNNEVIIDIKDLLEN